MARDFDHLYAYGDFYDVLDACAQLETLLGRLRRQNMLSNDDAVQSRRKVDDIRLMIELLLERASGGGPGSQAQ